MAKLKNIIHNILSILQWIPVLWNNWDWDSYYLFKVMRYKLIRMEKHIRKYGHSVNSDKDADEIKIAIQLLNRICDRDYHQNAEIKYSKIKKISWQISDYSKEELRTLKATWKHSDYMEKQDIKYLLEFINRNHVKWWD